MRELFERQASELHSDMLSAGLSLHGMWPLVRRLDKMFGQGGQRTAAIAYGDKVNLTEELRDIHVLWRAVFAARFQLKLSDNPTFDEEAKA
ncbi:MAG TPA: hypothetical protein QF873_00800 [Patescibacteria group bacterium]|nr:hypothetical protein [Patescibacteria group bacterium]